MNSEEMQSANLKRQAANMEKANTQQDVPSQSKSVSASDMKENESNVTNKEGHARELETKNTSGDTSSSKNKNNTTSSSSTAQPTINAKFNKESDRRACLSVIPLLAAADVKSFSDKVLYALGSEKQGSKAVINGKQLVNFLYSQLSGACGLIFPYTPKISQNYTINYEKTEIPHSNLQYNSYKNTPPPSISLDATFTADNYMQARHMLSAIWFLQAMSKCDVGKTEVSSGGGLPPPVLYLSAYHNLMSNIPVVLTSFSINYPDDCDYVRLLVDLTDMAQSQATNDQLYMYGNIERSIDGSYKTINLDNGVLQVWLPLKMSIGMQFNIQPNISKEENCFNLPLYKSGTLKMSDFAVAISSSGNYKNFTVTKNLKNYNGKYIPSGWTW